MSQPAAQPTVKVPGAGNVQRRYVVGGAVVVVAIVGYAYWRRSRAAQTVGIDTTTGSVGGSGSFVNPVPNADGFSSVSDNPTGEIRTDDEWARAVAEDFAQSQTYNAAFVQVTLGKYLAGQGLTSEEADLVRAAWALRGHPPSGIGITMATSGGAPGTPGPPTGDEKVWKFAPAGMVADDWIMEATAQTGVYWHQIVLLNPTIPGNISKNMDPRKRVFLHDASYRIR